MLAALAAGADGRPKDAHAAVEGAARSPRSWSTALREHPAADPRGARRAARAAWPTRCKDLDIVAAVERPGGAVEGVRRAAADRRGLRLGRGGRARRSRTPACRWTSGSCPRRRSATCSSTSPARASHNEALRTEAVRRGLHVSEYGIADDESGDSDACTTEEEVYERLGMQYIPPELRENRGELEAARKGTLPGADRAGRHPRRPAHAHDASDGHATIEEMAEAAKRARLRVRGDHRPLGHARLRQRRHAGRAAADRSSEIRGAAATSGITRARGHRDERAARRLARLRGRRARAARLGRGEPPHLLPAVREGADEADAAARWSTRSWT